MKIYLIIILILIYSGLACGQATYINNQYGFGLKFPEGFEISHDLDGAKYLQTYICNVGHCEVFGVFSITKASEIPNQSRVEAVRTFQSRSFLEKSEKEFLAGTDERLNATILSSQYAAYQGRPGFKIDYNFVSEGKSFTGSRIIIYLYDKHILVGLNSISLDSGTDKWKIISDKIINSISTDLQSLRLPGKNRPSSAFVLGSKDADFPSPPPPRPMPPPIPKKVSLGVVNGMAIDLALPSYPASAKGVHASGAVYIQVEIDEQGNVTSAAAVSGHELLRKPAEAAALKSKFKPVILSGQAIKASGVIIYNFVAQ